MCYVNSAVEFTGWVAGGKGRTGDDTPPDGGIGILYTPPLESIRNRLFLGWLSGGFWCCPDARNGSETDLFPGLNDSG